MQDFPENLGLDYSIELFGFDMAWELFWGKLRSFGCIRTHLKDIDVWRIRAMFNNGDIRGYLTSLVDSKAISYENALKFVGYVQDINYPKPSTLKQSVISKWVPGDHYYALGFKFDSFEEAEKHLTQNGYISLGLREKFIYE